MHSLTRASTHSLTHPRTHLRAHPFTHLLTYALYPVPTSVWEGPNQKHGCEEHARIHGLAVLPVSPHHRHLRPGTMGEIHLQYSPLYYGGHGGLYFLRLRTHPRAPGTGVLLRTVWGAAGEYRSAYELKYGLFVSF